MSRHSKLFSTLAIIVVVLGLTWRFLPQVWATSADVVHKWAWSGQRDTTSGNQGELYGLGWLSTNCLNDFDNNGVLESQCGVNDGTPEGSTKYNYGLTVNINGTNTKNRVNSSNELTLDGVNDYLQGCAWSGIYGWVCFSQEIAKSPDTTTDVTVVCPTATAVETYDKICGKLNPLGVKIEQISGTQVYYLKSSINPATGDADTIVNSDAQKDARAAVLNLSQDDDQSRAYIGFPADFTSSAAVVSLPSNAEVSGCFGCWSGTSGYNNACKGCYLVNDGYNDATLAPNPNILCVNCTQCQTTVYGGSCTSTANRCKASSCTCYRRGGVVVNYYPSCNSDATYCVNDGQCGPGNKCNYTKSAAELCGWGYNAWDNSGTLSGFGWIAFNPVVYGSATPFTQAQRGSVYSENNILSYLTPPEGQSNATYLIDAKGRITRWSSSGGPTLEREFLPNAPSFLGYDPNTSQSTSTIGIIDWGGISKNVGSATQKINKYAAPIEEIESSDFVDNLQLVLKNKVYYAASDLIINHPFSVYNGSTNESGAGIIYVAGDLTINRDVIYHSGTTGLTRTQHIPSLVWIVMGDVTIDPGVTNLAGTFIVLGSKIDHSSCPAITDALNPPASGGCGRFSTGNDRSTPRQLSIYGNVVAKQFNLQRSYSGALKNEPAEIFIADGRLQANPPAGMTDFSKSLPRFSFGF
ncbi:MAG: hypothetical protein V1846_01495 [Candidatus Komeilibacteria bacterium]